jgi:translation elongation factor P/translation initiation factor 5A
MGLSMQQALTIGKAFRAEGLLVSKAEDVEQFNKTHIKNLSATDRKICYQALSNLDKAQLSDFEQENTDIVQLDPDRVELIAKTIVEEPVSAEPKKTGWYAKPFLWIAHKAHSFFLWFKNTFMGRVSTDKLWNKVEAYLNDVRVAEKRVKVLNEDNGEIAKAKNTTEEQAARQKEFLEAEFKTLVEAREVIIQIYLGDTCFQDCRRNLHKEWILDGFNEEVIPKQSFREVIIEAIEGADRNVQNFLQPLYNLAKDEDSNEEALREAFKTASETIKSEMASKVDEGEKLFAELKAAHKQQIKLESEARLLDLKYQIAV